MYVLKENGKVRAVLNDGKDLVDIISAKEPAKNTVRYSNIISSIRFGESFSFENFTVECVKDSEISSAVSEKIIKSVLLNSSALDSNPISVLFEVENPDVDVVESCQKAAIEFCKTPNGFHDFYETNDGFFGWNDLIANIPDEIFKKFGLKKLNSSETIETNECLISSCMDLLDKNDKAQIYQVSLIQYDENNIPVPVTDVFVYSEFSLEIPDYILKKLVVFEELLEEFACESIGNIYLISEDEFKRDYPDEELYYL